MAKIPSAQEITELHRKHAPSVAAFELVYTHCQIVWAVAEQLITATPHPTVNPGLVKAGCLLHDIGVYRLYLPDGQIDHVNYIKHGILGYELLQKAGYSEDICRFALRHTGVGLTKHDIATQNLPLPSQDYLAENPEERLVMYADKFHSKSTPPTFLTASSYRQQISRFGNDKAVAFDALVEEFGAPQLEQLAARYNSRIV